MNNDTQHPLQSITDETPMKEKIRRALESQITLKQIVKLEKEIASMEKKLSMKKEKLVELSKRL